MCVCGYLGTILTNRNKQEKEMNLDCHTQNFEYLQQSKISWRWVHLLKLLTEQPRLLLRADSPDLVLRRTVQLPLEDQSPAPAVTSQWIPSHLRSLSPVNIKLHAFLFPFFLLYFKRKLLFLATFKI